MDNNWLAGAASWIILGLVGICIFLLLVLSVIVLVKLIIDVLYE